MRFGWGPHEIFVQCIAWVFLLLTGNVALAQISDLNSAINKAGRQRMLSQRMAKAYFQIGQQIEVDRSKKVLDSSMAVFDRQLVRLKNYAPTRRSRKPTASWRNPGWPIRMS